MMKRYFCKVSWTDPAQPLVRIHDNGFMEIDFSETNYEWAIQEEYKNQNRSLRDTLTDFVIDFMIEA